jgi:hypothetical protein
MASFVLVSHGDFPSNAIRTIAVEASRGDDGRLDLEFVAAGAVDRVRWPDWKAVEQADRLWEHSCFELFVRAPDATDYAELNFSTSGQWAAYRFDGYRSGMRPVDDVLVGGGRTFGDGEVRIRRTINLPDWSGAGEWHVGLSAVIETLDGDKSYWALAHPAGPPDFHDAVCFAARLAAPTLA